MGDAAQLSGIDVLRAALPLHDSANATFSLMHVYYPIDWRFDFIVAITTLRTVGHVLQKVDCLRFPVIKDEVQSRYQRWKRGEGDDVVFTDFIETARNTLLKTYTFPSNDGIIFDEEEFGLSEIAGPSPDLIQSGPFEGEDVIGLLQFAHRWWNHELSEIAAQIPVGMRARANE